MGFLRSWSTPRGLLTNRVLRPCRRHLARVYGIFFQYGLNALAKLFRQAAGIRYVSFYRAPPDQIIRRLVGDVDDQGSLCVVIASPVVVTVRHHAKPIGHIAKPIRHHVWPIGIRSIGTISIGIMPFFRIRFVTHEKVGVFGVDVDAALGELFFHGCFDPLVDQAAPVLRAAHLYFGRPPGIRAVVTEVDVAIKIVTAHAASPKTSAIASMKLFDSCFIFLDFYVTT